MRFAILGAGGIGGYYGAALARSGNDVRVLARGANLAALRANGIEARTPDESWHSPVHATDDPAELGDVDTAVISVKSYSLDQVAPAARHLAERGAVVLPLLNGVDATDRLAALGVPAPQLLAGVAYISAVRVAPGIFERRSPLHRIHLGEPNAGAITPRAKAIAAAFHDAGLNARAEEDMPLALWQKYVFLTSVAAACGLSRSPVGPVRESTLGRLLLERAVREAIAVGRARGVSLPDNEFSRVMEYIDSLPGTLSPSFLLDLQSGRETELDTLSGTVSRFAAELHIETPIHDTAAAALALASR